MKVAFAAADELVRDGVSAEVIDLRTILSPKYSDHHCLCEKNQPAGDFGRSMALWLCNFR